MKYPSTTWQDNLIKAINFFHTITKREYFPLKIRRIQSRNRNGVFRFQNVIIPDSSWAIFSKVFSFVGCRKCRGVNDFPSRLDGRSWAIEQAINSWQPVALKYKFTCIVSGWTDAKLLLITNQFKTVIII